MTETYSQFIIAEDEALRDLLKGMTVEDDKDTNRAVGVWYGQPDIEMRAQSFPFVTIDMIAVSEATERVMNAQGVQPWYYPPPDMTTASGTADDWSTPWPVPVNLDYQVTSFARQPRHDRQILAQILGNRLPFRFGSLVVKEKTTDDGANVTIDTTTRRLDMRGVAKRDTIESGKRMFMNVFTVRVSSELPSPYVARLHKRVSVINSTLGYHPTGVLLGPPSFKESFTISVPTGTP